MQRYFVPADNWQGHNVIIDHSDAHHITKVMRMATDDRIICVHPDGDAAETTIISADDNEVLCQIDTWINQNMEMPVKVTIAQGLPKSDKLERVLQKGTEMGAYDFIPFKASRSIVKWDEKKEARRMMRYEKIIKEAAEQSRRTHLPNVYSPVDQAGLLKYASDYDVCLYAYEEEAKSDNHVSGLVQSLQQLASGMTLLVCIGPEGGFSPSEADAFNQAGFFPIRTGPRILRTETAALYVLSVLSYQFEELGCQK